MPCRARRSASAARTFPPRSGGKVTAFFRLSEKSLDFFDSLSARTASSGAGAFLCLRLTDTGSLLGAVRSGGGRRERRRGGRGSRSFLADSYKFPHIPSKYLAFFHKAEIFPNRRLHFQGGSAIMCLLSEQVFITDRQFSPTISNLRGVMNMKRILASALSAAILMGALAGCGG